jgi:hypothetical protein
LSAKPTEESVNHKDLLYGEHYCRNAIIIHEGPTDVWRTGPGAVAILGLNCSSAQLDRMAQYPVRAIWFDNEPAAQQRAADLYRRLSALDGETALVRTDSEDPATSSDEDVCSIRKEFLS